jgi:hypothetical protein
LKIKTRVVLTVLLLVAWYAASTVFTMAQGPIESAVAVKQLEDSGTTYAASRTLSQGGIPMAVNLAGLGLLLLLWVPFLVRKAKSLGAGTAVIALVASALMTGCVGPPQLEVIKEIKPNETAYLVPLEGDTKNNQGKFMSVDYLEKSKVAMKRVNIPTRKQVTGRMWGKYIWIPTVQLITVDRTPITREWTKSPETGTSTSNQAIAVESSESVDFYLGVVAQGMIKEDDASKFLYYFAGKTLAQVMDENVRGFVQSALWKEFGSVTLTKGKESKRAIMDTVYKETAAFFAPQGVTIAYVGGAEGLTFKDQAVQAAINKAFVAENDKKVAFEEQKAQETRNATDISVALAKQRVAAEFSKNMPAQIAMRELEIKTTLAEAAKIEAQNWNGVRSMIVGGSGGSGMGMFFPAGAPLFDSFNEMNKKAPERKPTQKK